ncbi:MAG: FecR domain-containing protein [Polyangia bacterium]
MAELPELHAAVARAAARIEPSWSPTRQDALLKGVYRKRRRRRLVRASAGVGAALGAVLVLFALVPRESPLRSASLLKPAQTASSAISAPATPLQRATGSETLRFTDGSVAQPQGGRSQLVIRDQRPGRTVVELRGAARFAVTHNPQRLFRVEAGGVAVEVLGTRFTVEQTGERVHVAVQEGKVRVLWAANYAEVATGQSADFPSQPAPASAPDPSAAEPAAGQTGPAAPAERAVAPAPSAVYGPAAELLREPPVRAAAPSRRPSGHTSPGPGPQAAPEPAVAAAAATAAATRATPPATLPPPVAPTPDWKARASEGDFATAYRLAYEPTVPGEGPRQEGLGPGDLLLLADVARLSRHPAAAVPPLLRLLREHGSDPRAPLAAFTLGRVQLDDLGRPREAAESFRRAEDLDPNGPLAQDALAREVEAWSRAGETGRARERASAYVQRYPNGRRLRSVRQYGALD